VELDLAFLTISDWCSKAGQESGCDEAFGPHAYFQAPRLDFADEAAGKSNAMVARSKLASFRRRAQTRGEYSPSRSRSVYGASNPAPRRREFHVRRSSPTTSPSGPSLGEYSEDIQVRIYFASAAI
jgi:hypothetical protein